MNSDRRLLALALAALSTAACLDRSAPKPPTFQGGGLLSRSTPPPNPWSLPSVLEGVYDTSSRFGPSVVVHASQWGSIEGGIQASVSILAKDHFAYALMQPGCFLDPSTSPATLRLVLEGYWRYLDTPDPTPTTNGLIRLFVGPQALVDHVCNAAPWVPALGPRDPFTPPPGVHATLTGATGAGDQEPGLPLNVTWVGARKARAPRDAQGACLSQILPSGECQPTFLVGTHHGGCQTTDNCGISENTPLSTILATQLGGDYMEIDTHLTADGVPVFFHMGLNPAVVQGIYCTGNIEDYTYAQLLANCRLRNGEIIPRFEDMAEFILTHTKMPMYLDSKTTNVIVPVSQALGKLATELVPCTPPDGTYPPPAGKRCLFPGSTPVMQRGIIGLPAQDFFTTFQQAQAAGQLAPNQHFLIEEDAADMTAIPGGSAWMPRYTRGPMVSSAQSLQQQGFFVGYWTINDPATIDAFLTTAVPNGILTNYLGLLNQRFEAVGTPPPYPLTKPATTVP
jgi:glycerophosphoryl diester phosphodiesterase